MQDRGAKILTWVLAAAVAGCGGKTRRERANSGSDVPTQGVSMTSPSGTAGSLGAPGAPGVGGEAAADDAIGGAGGSGGGIVDADADPTRCSDAIVVQLDQWVLDLASDLQLAKQDISQELAEACSRIVDDLSGTPAPLAVPPTLSEVRAACQSALEAIDATLAELVARPTVTRQSCGCAINADEYFGCYDECLSLGDGDGYCNDSCFCHQFCDARGMVRPRCSDCQVSIGVDHATLAAVLATNLPFVYDALDRADLASWGAETLFEAGAGLRDRAEEECGAEFVAPLDDALWNVQTCANDLSELSGDARLVADAVAGP